MERFTIGVVGLGQQPHARCFEDFARAMSDALRALGYAITDFGENQGRLLVFGGGNLVVDPSNKMPADTIIYNAEQFTAVDHIGKQMSNYQYYRDEQITVWDYSGENVRRLRAAGIKAVLCPVGYVPSMTKIKPAEEDIDVLHYGSLNPRRKEILEACEASGLKVVHAFGVYGEERDEVIARAKVVLNLHFFEKPVFEIFRCSHLFANKKCVVSEDGGQDLDLEAFATRAAWVVSRNRIVDVCKLLVRDADLRRGVAERGFDEFKRINLAENVRRALEVS